MIKAKTVFKKEVDDDLGKSILKVDLLETGVYNFDFINKKKIVYSVIFTPETLKEILNHEKDWRIKCNM